MRKRELTEEQVAMALRQHEARTTVREICRKLEFSETTSVRWRKRFGRMGVSRLRELRQVRAGNRKLHGLLADPSLDETILQEALNRQW